MRGAGGHPQRADRRTHGPRCSASRRTPRIVEPDRAAGVQQSVRRLNWTTIALIGALVMLVAVIAYFATRGNSAQDKLTKANVTASTVPSREKLCASKATYDLIKS